MLNIQNKKKLNGFITIERLLGIVFFLLLLTVMIPMESFEARVPGYQGFIVVIALVVLILFLWLTRLFVKTEVIGEWQRTNNRTMWIATIVLFAVQLFIGYNIMFRTSWDVAAVHYSSLYASLGDSEGMKNMSDYLSYYPNNLFLVFVYSSIYKLNILLESPVSNHLVLLVFLQCAISAITAALTYLCSVHIVGPILAWVVYIVYIIMIGTSPWIVVPYSDSTGLFFPMLILYLYIRFKNRENKYHRYILLVLISFFAYIGFKIKPTIAIAFIAIVGVEFWMFLCDKKRNIALYLKCVIIIIVTMIGSKAISDAAIDSLGYEINHDMSFGVEHWILLGSNSSSYGRYNQADFDFSASFSTPKERNAQDVKEAINRYKSRGMLGNINFLRIKMWREFTDATFGWGGSGPGYYMEVYPEKIPVVTGVLRSLYYDEYNGNLWLFPYYAYFRQIIWYIMLILIACFGLIWPKKHSGDSERVVALSLVGLVLYLLIFESHPRYLIIFVPFMIIMAVKSFQELLHAKEVF